MNQSGSILADARIARVARSSGIRLRDWSRPTPATLKPLPAIATHWDISDDGRVYRFYLRPSFWSDGHPLTADDFVFAFQRLVDPQTGSKYASNGFIFQQGLAISRGEAAVNSLGVRALDSHTLEIELVDPLPYFLNFLSFYSFMPIPQHLLQNLQKRGIDQDLWTRPEHVICNGAFRMTDWQFRQHMTFEKKYEILGCGFCQTRSCPRCHGGKFDDGNEYVCCWGV